jgi:hypothetical protein
MLSTKSVMGRAALLVLAGRNVGGELLHQPVQPSHGRWSQPGAA